MIRLMGILTGAAIAVAFLLIAFGVPDFHAGQEASAAPQQRLEQVDSLPEPETAATVEAAPAVAAAGDYVVVTPPGTPGATPSEPSESEPLEVAEEIAAPLEREALAAGAFERATAEPQWYAFWSPFRSELAADGFVAELQRTTGLDYRVVKLKPGVYEVAFAYADDADIENKLARISSATGLDLSGG